MELDKQTNRTNNNSVTPDEINGLTLAHAVSQILKNPHLPPELNDAIRDGIDDIASNADSAMLRDFETSPEYLKVVFAAYEAKNPHSTTKILTESKENN